MIIQLTTNAEQIASGLEHFRVRGIGMAVAAAMNRENQMAIARISSERLSGQGPFPPADHRLGARTNRLRQSLRASEAVVLPDAVVSTIGSNVFYAAIHEFGAEFTRKKTVGMVRLRTDAKGNLLRQPRGGAIFASKEHKRASERVFLYKSDKVKFPERAPIGTGLEDHVPNYSRSISAAVENAWNQGGQQS